MTQKRQMQRRDATGHLDPKYAAHLRVRSLENAKVGNDVAFVGRPKSSDPLASALGQEFVATATTGEAGELEAFNERIPEDDGGPFVITSGRDEFGRGRDPSNPNGATREPFPKAMADGNQDQEDEQDDSS
jgi:hypothetical protein